jgi:hypothetical protein
MPIRMPGSGIALKLNLNQLNVAVRPGVNFVIPVINIAIVSLLLKNDIARKH